MFHPIDFHHPLALHRIVGDLRVIQDSEHRLEDFPAAAGDPVPRAVLVELGARHGGEQLARGKRERELRREGGREDPELERVLVQTVRGIAFNQGSRAEELGRGQRVDAVFHASFDTWRGGRRVQLVVRDIRTR